MSQSASEPTAKAAKRGQFKRILLIHSLLTAAITTVIRFWPVSTDTLVVIPGLSPDGSKELLGLVNQDGRVIAEPQWQFIGNFQPTGVAVVAVDEESQYLIDRKGRVISEKFYRVLSFTEDGKFASAESETGCGIIDHLGNWVIHVEGHRFPFIDGYMDGAFDEMGYVLIQKSPGPQKNSQAAGPVDPFAYPGGSSPSIFGDIYGWISTAGNFEIQSEWELRSGFGEPDWFDSAGMTIVKKGGLEGVINRKGEVVIPIIYKDVRWFDHAGFIYVELEDGSRKLLDKAGNEPFSISRWKSEVHFGESGHAEVWTESGVGLINTSGEYVIKPEWQMLSRLPSDELVLVEKDDKYGWVDFTGEVIISPDWDNVGVYKITPNNWREEEPRCRKVGDIGWYIPSSREMLIPQWEFVSDISTQSRFGLSPDQLFDVEGMAMIAINTPWEWVDGSQYWGWVNSKGEVVIEPKWDAVRAFDPGGLAPVMKNKKWGWINRSGDLVIDTIYDMTLDFDFSGMASIKKDGKWGWINRIGEMVIGASYDEASFFESDDFAYVKINDKGIWIDRNGDQVVPAPWREDADPTDQQSAAWLEENGRLDNAIYFDDRRFDGVFAVASLGGLTFYEPNGKILSTLEFGNTLVDHNDLFLTDSGHASPRGMIMTFPEGYDWEWPNYDRWSAEGGNLPMEHYQISTKVNRPFLERTFVKIQNWFGSDSPHPLNADSKTWWIVYHKSGKVVWDSQKMTFESKCHLVIGGSLLVALICFLRRPRNSKIKEAVA